MLKTSYFFSASGNGASDNTTRYFCIGGAASVHSTEAPAETTIKQAGIFKNLFTNVSANTINANSTVTLRKSTADTSITLTYTSLQTGIKEDTSNTSTFANTDTACFKIVASNDPGGANSITVELATIIFSPSLEETIWSKFIASTSSTTISTASATRYGPPNGLCTISNSTEANVKYRCSFGFTLNNLYVYVATNSRTTDTTFGTRKNGGAGTQSVLYSSGQTGSKQDTSNADTFAEGDDLNYYVTTGTGTGILSIIQVSTCYSTTSNSFQLTAGRDTKSVSFNTTLYCPISGNINNTPATEDLIQSYPSFNFVLCKMYMYSSANTIATSPTVITVRRNSSNSSITISYNAGQTGLKSDLTNSFDVIAGVDKINFSVVTPNTSGTFSFTWCGFNAQTRFNRGPAAAMSGAAGFQF